MPKRMAKVPGRSAKQPPRRKAPGWKCPATQVAVESTNPTGTKRRKTASRPLTTDNLPALVKEVCKNLRLTSDDTDSSSDVSHDEDRRTTHQASQKQSDEQDSPARNKGGAGRKTATHEQRAAAQHATRRRSSGIRDTDWEDQVDDGEYII